MPSLLILHQAMPTPRISAARRLPLGWMRGLGQDDGGDGGFDFSSIDVSSEVPTLPSIAPVSIPDLGPTPTIPTVDLTSITGTGTTDLNTAIWNGALAPPAGSGLTAADVAAAKAYGATPADIGTMLQNPDVFNQFMLQQTGAQYQQSGAANAAAVAAAAKTAATLPSTPTGLRPTPLTAATGITAIPGTAINPLSALESATILPGVPNWVLLVGVVVVAGGLGASKRRSAK